LSLDCPRRLSFSPPTPQQIIVGRSFYSPTLCFSLFFPQILVWFFDFPSVGWPLGSNGCGSMAVTGLPLSELQARWSPEFVFMAILFLFCRRYWELAISVDALPGLFLARLMEFLAVHAQGRIRRFLSATVSQLNFVWRPQLAETSLAGSGFLLTTSVQTSRMTIPCFSTLSSSKL
ncbi:hypothetical protein LINPERPRIM_LOCUS25864, partial [Linum perenne]